MNSTRQAREGTTEGKYTLADCMAIIPPTEGIHSNNVHVTNTLIIGGSIIYM